MNPSRPWLYCLLPLFPSQFLTDRARQVKTFPAKKQSRVNQPMDDPAGTGGPRQRYNQPLASSKNTLPITYAK